MELHVKRFEPSKMAIDPVILILGRRGAGKTFLIRNLLYELRHIGRGIIISETAHFQNSFDKCFPSLFIYSHYEPTKMKEIFRKQELRIQKIRRQGLEPTNDDRLLVLMDDVLSQDDWTKDEVIKHIFFNGRHALVTFILGLQWVKSIEPRFRSQIDYTFMFHFPDIDTQEKLHKNFGGAFANFGQFREAFEQICQNRTALVVDRKTESVALEDRVLYFRAQAYEFKFGNEKFWDYHYENYDPDYFEKDESEQKMDELKNRYKAKILVCKDDDIVQT